MLFHMKTTLDISENVMRQLKQEAARTGRTMSELVESALCEALASRKTPVPRIELPMFSGGRPRVDISNREMLYEVGDSV